MIACSVQRRPITGHTLLILPIAVQEVLLAVWLLGKSFSPACLILRPETACSSQEVLGSSGHLGASSSFAVGLLFRLLMLAALAGTVVTRSPAQATPSVIKAPVAVGRGGAAATVDVDATRVAIKVLRHGGNAVDAAVAAAATLGVTEPFSAGIGGGGFFVYYDARTKTVHTIDGREAAPAAVQTDAFVDPPRRQPFAFQAARVSGISVGVPGTPKTWQTALRKWGVLRDALRPADQGRPSGLRGRPDVRRPDDRERRAVLRLPARPVTSYLRRGRPAAVGSVFRNRDLADTTTCSPGRASTRSTPASSPGTSSARSRTRRSPRHRPATCVVRPGLLELSDLASYQAHPARTHARVATAGSTSTAWRPPSSGGSTVGEGPEHPRGLGPGGPFARPRPCTGTSRRAHSRSPTATGTSATRRSSTCPSTSCSPTGSRAERACLIDPADRATKPVAPGVPDGDYATCEPRPPAPVGSDGQSTTHLTTADRWGNVVSYTLTIDRPAATGSWCRAAASCSTTS